MRRLIEQSHLELCCLQKPIIFACGSEKVKDYLVLNDFGLENNVGEITRTLNILYCQQDYKTVQMSC